MGAFQAELTMVFDTRPILVPLDGSSNAEIAIAPALQLARRLGASVQFVHAVDPSVFEGDIDVEHARQTFEGYARQAIADRGGEPGSVTVVSGNAARAVLAESAKAQALVLATHGRGGIKASLIGSVADKIIRGARVPAFVIPSGSTVQPGDGPVLVALDGSPEAERGLAAGREVAKLFGAGVALVRAYSIPPPVGVEFVAYPVDLSESLKEGAESYLKGVAAAGEQTFAIMLPAADAIDEAAESCGASLVVVTSHGKGFAQRLALGSVTDRVVHTCKRPILVVPIED
jgi:nucleotide-binding universal stress UspA family protein